MTVPLLPYDILVAIIDSIEAVHDPVTTTSILHSLSLTSTSWSSLAQPRLYSNPTFPLKVTYPRAIAFLSTLQSRPRLATAVRSLNDLGTWTSTLREEAKYDRRIFSKWAIDVLRACERVTKLSWPWVTCADARELERVLIGLREVESVTLGEGLRIKDPWVINVDFSIRDAFGSAVWTISDIARITSPTHWPNLHTLQVRSPLSPSPATSPAPIPHSPHQLTCSLKQITIAYNPNLMVDFTDVSSLLIGSKDSLRTLELLEHQLTPGTFIHVLAEFGSNLTRLSTASLNQHELLSPELLSTIGTTCLALEELHLGSRFRATPENFALLATLPNLKHLELSSINYLAVPDTSFPRAELVPTSDVALVLESFSPSLRTITLGAENRALTEWDANILWKEGDVMELEGRMELRGVKLLCREFFPALSGRSLRSLMAWSRLEV